MAEEKETLVTFKGKYAARPSLPSAAHGGGSTLHRALPNPGVRGSSLVLSLGRNNGVTCLTPRASVLPANKRQGPATGPKR